jgi:predicted RNA binding protein YcfA (HicA-like mRNA interferase family)
MPFMITEFCPMGMALQIRSRPGRRHVMRHPDGRTVPVPVHPGRDMPKGTLRNILGNYRHEG